MDPSIMKLLEEDEDESMHSGADVEAFPAALNRDIEGPGASCSQPSHSDSSALSQENNQTSSQMYSQWQPSNQDESKRNQGQQQELMNQEQREQQSSEMEVKEHVSSAEVQREVNGSQAPGGLPMQYKPMQVDSKGLRDIRLNQVLESSLSLLLLCKCKYLVQVMLRFMNLKERLIWVGNLNSLTCQDSVINRCQFQNRLATQLIVQSRYLLEVCFLSSCLN